MYSLVFGLLDFFSIAETIHDNPDAFGRKLGGFKFWHMTVISYLHTLKELGHKRLTLQLFKLHNFHFFKHSFNCCCFLVSLFSYSRQTYFVLVSPNAMF